MNNNWGGKRKGSGRKKMDPRLKKVTVTYRLDPQIALWLRSQHASSASLIELALMDKFNLAKANSEIEINLMG